MPKVQIIAILFAAMSVACGGSDTSVNPSNTSKNQSFEVSDTAPSGDRASTTQNAELATRGASSTTGGGGGGGDRDYNSQVKAPDAQNISLRWRNGA